MVRLLKNATHRTGNHANAKDGVDISAFACMYFSRDSAYRILETHTGTHVTADANHDRLRDIFHEPRLCHFYKLLDRRRIFILRLLQRLGESRSNLSDAFLELVVFVACQNRFGGIFLADVVGQYLFGTDVVCVGFHELVGFALDARHDEFWLGVDVAMCVWYCVKYSRSWKGDRV